VDRAGEGMDKELKGEVRRKRRDPAATKDKILVAAEKLFSRKGFSGTSMSEIAAKGKVTQSLIHHYFGSKEGLFLEVMRRHLVRMGRMGRKRMEQAIQGDDYLAAGLTAYFRMLADTPLLVHMGAWFTLFFLQHPRPVRMIEGGDAEEDANQRYIFDLCEDMVRAMSEMQQKGLMRQDIDPAALLMMIFSAAEHWHEAKLRLLRRLPHDTAERVDDDKYLETLIKIIIDGARPRPAQA